MSFRRKMLLVFSLLFILSSMVESIFSLPMGSVFFFSPPYRPRETDHDQKVNCISSLIFSTMRSTLRSSKETSQRTG